MFELVKISLQNRIMNNGKININHNKILAKQYFWRCEL